MKNANEKVFTCEMFRDMLYDYIDDELENAVRNQFSDHAKGCPQCSALLRESVAIHMCLSNMTPVTVSRTFDFELKNRIRFEQKQLGNPFYRFRLFLRDNAANIVAVPAIALLIFGVVFLPVDMHFNQNAPVEVSQNVQLNETSDLSSIPEDPENEIVNYVLDSVQPLEAEKGVFLNEQPSTQLLTTNSNIMLISF